MYGQRIDKLAHTAAKHASVTVYENQNMYGQRIDMVAHTAAKHASVLYMNTKTCMDTANRQATCSSYGSQTCFS